ncbi:MAG: transglycosylase SLT domain-containing protein [Patescibacteria group bacterium]|jgi:hypothetical protein
MKVLRLLFLSAFLLTGLLAFPGNGKAGCCLCGNLNDDNFQCLINVTEAECNSCGNFPHPFYETNDACTNFCAKPVDVSLKNCCVYTGKIDKLVKECKAVQDETSCQTGEFEINRKEYIAQDCAKQPQCSLIGSKYVAEKKSDIYFKPQVSLLGSKFIAGEEIVITGNTLGEYIAAFYVFFVSAIAILAAVMIMYGGIKWLVAGGNRGQVQNAKEQITSAIIGLLIAFAAYLLLLSISPKLVKFTSLNITSIKPIEQAINKQEIAYGSKGNPLGKATMSKTWYENVKAKYGSFVATAAKNTGIDENLIYAIMFVESGGQPNLSSEAGACGLMQLLPATASQVMKTGVSCSDLYNPSFGIAAGAAYLAQLKEDTCPDHAMKKDESIVSCTPSLTKCTDGDLMFVIAAYNGGQGANCSSVDCPGQTWWECPVNTGYQQTRDYVIKVQNNLKIISDY